MNISREQQQQRHKHNNAFLISKPIPALIPVGSFSSNSANTASTVDSESEGSPPSIKTIAIMSSDMVPSLPSHKHRSGDRSGNSHGSACLNDMAKEMILRSEDSNADSVDNADSADNDTHSSSSHDDHDYSCSQQSSASIDEELDALLELCLADSTDDDGDSDQQQEKQQLLPIASNHRKHKKKKRRSSDGKKRHIIDCVATNAYNPGLSPEALADLFYSHIAGEDPSDSFHSENSESCDDDHLVVASSSVTQRTSSTSSSTADHEQQDFPDHGSFAGLQLEEMVAMELAVHHRNDHHDQHSNNSSNSNSSNNGSTVDLTPEQFKQHVADNLPQDVIQNIPDGDWDGIYDVSQHQYRDESSVSSSMSALTNPFPPGGCRTHSDRQRRTSSIRKANDEAFAAALASPWGQDTTASPTPTNTKKNKSVTFDRVQVRHYKRILSDNPSCRFGPSIGIGWKYRRAGSVSVDEWESRRSPRRCRCIMSRDERTATLLELGYTPTDLAGAIREKLRIQNRRRQTIHNLAAAKMEEAVELAKRKIKSVITLRVGKKNKNSSASWMALSVK